MSNYQKERKRKWVKWVLKIEKREKERQRRKNGSKTKEEILGEIVVSIKRDGAINPKQRKIGEERESRFEKTLEFLLKKKRILGYKRSGKLSRADIKGGIDFYLIVLNGSRRGVYCVDVTGPDWVEEKKRRSGNGKKKIIGIEPDEPIEHIIKKIEKEIPLMSLIPKDS